MKLAFAFFFAYSLQVNARRTNDAVATLGWKAMKVYPELIKANGISDYLDSETRTWLNDKVHLLPESYIEMLSKAPVDIQHFYYPMVRRGIESWCPRYRDIEGKYMLPEPVDAEKYAIEMPIGSFVGEKPTRLEDAPGHDDMLISTPYGYYRAEEVLQTWLQGYDAAQTEILLPNMTFNAPLAYYLGIGDDDDEYDYEDEVRMWLACIHEINVTQECSSGNVSRARNESLGVLTIGKDLLRTMRAMRDTLQVEIGGALYYDASNDRISLAAFTSGESQSVMINKDIQMSWHTHPKSGDRLVSPPSEMDIGETLAAQLTGARVDNVLFAPEGTYTYRISDWLLECYNKTRKCPEMFRAEMSDWSVRYFVQDMRRLLGFTTDPHSKSWHHPQISLSYFIAIMSLGGIDMGFYPSDYDGNIYIRRPPASGERSDFSWLSSKQVSEATGTGGSEGGLPLRHSHTEESSKARYEQYLREQLAGAPPWDRSTARLLAIIRRMQKKASGYITGWFGLGATFGSIDCTWFEEGLRNISSRENAGRAVPWYINPGARDPLPPVAIRASIGSTPTIVFGSWAFCLYHGDLSAVAENASLPFYDQLVLFTDAGVAVLCSDYKFDGAMILGEVLVAGEPCKECDLVRGEKKKLAPLARVGAPPMNSCQDDAGEKKAA